MTKIRELYWYVLAAYLVALALGAVAFLALIATTNKIGFIAVGGVGGLVLLILASLPTFPALYRDVGYVRTATDWNPNPWPYLLGGALTPVVGFVVGGDIFGPRINLVLSVLSWLGSVATMSLVYLYRRHRFVGVP